MLNIIPKPNNFCSKEGNFVLPKSANIACPKLFEQAGLALIEYAKAEKDTNLAFDNKNAKIIFLENAQLDSEEYVLDIKKSGIEIQASSSQGAFYAVQTLRQAWEQELPCCAIQDKPRFTWRGLLLDESRHFFGKESVKKLLDMMAYYKLNIFHWHLTDDQGWRIEIKKYPLLTKIGSVRKGTHIHGWRRANLKKDVIWEEYGGFYTQDDIKEIVAYAQERGINIVPEIDMPGHFAAALAAYNWLGCRELKRDVAYYFGGKIPFMQGIRDWNRSACVGKDSTYEFIYNIIDEIVELFPFPYFHIGGDEADKSEWKKCAHCAKVMEEHNLKDYNELQAHFNNKIITYLKSKGRRLIGWNEVLAGGNIDNSVVAQYWTLKRDTNAEMHINNGGNLIMSRHNCFYFDMCHAQVSLKNTYTFSPIHEGIESGALSNIIGVEGCLWTEWVDSQEKLELNLYPRMIALAETGWTQEGGKDWQDFLCRLSHHEKTLDRLGINYAHKDIYLSNNKLRNWLDIKRWYTKDQHFELRRNKELKGK